MKSNPWIMLCLLVFSAAAASGCAVSADATHQPAENGDASAVTTTPIDPLVGNLPPAVLRTYQARFPSHRIWQISKTGEGASARYELVIFDPQSTTAHTQGVNSASVTTILSYTLILDGDGAVIREDPHPVSVNAIPQAARQAVENWSRHFPRSTDMEWLSHQEEGSERLYSLRVILNSIEDYGATVKADGTFVKQQIGFNKER